MIEYKGIQYETRDIDMSIVWGEEDYTITVAPHSLAVAMEEGKGYWDLDANPEISQVDNQLAGYVDDNYWDSNPTDEELAKWVDEHLYN